MITEEKWGEQEPGYWEDWGRGGGADEERNGANV